MVTPFGTFPGPLFPLSFLPLSSKSAASTSTHPEWLFIKLRASASLSEIDLGRRAGLQNSHHAILITWRYSSGSDAEAEYELSAVFQSVYTTDCTIWRASSSSLAVGRSLYAGWWPRCDVPVTRTAGAMLSNKSLHSQLQHDRFFSH